MIDRIQLAPSNGIELTGGLMVTTKIQRLAATREKLSELERLIAAELPKELANLPEQYGFATVREFTAAVESAAGKRRPGRRGRKPGRPKKAVAAPKTRKRAVITDAIRTKVKKLIKAGTSGSKIAKVVKISLPSVQNIKKALGLVRTRGTKTKKAPPKGAPAKRKATKKRAARKAPAKGVTASAPQPPVPAVAPAG